MIGNFTSIIRILFAAIGTISFASIALADNLACKPIEYAQLKDSSKQELVEAYCIAIQFAELNKKLFELDKQIGDIKEMQRRSEARVSCIEVAGSASRMLEKKYKAKPPESCK